MRRRITVCGAVGVLLYLGFLGCCYFSDGVTKGNYLRIKSGMRKSEIRWLLGGLFGMPDRTAQKSATAPFSKPGAAKMGGMSLHFDEQEQIIWKEWDDALYRETFLRVLRDGGRIRE